ncbi:RidA family protein [Reyranella sp.]|uniref:RidA family protein n=1 Tax=Reyranella sp. TaxID=1929291 RepID=UPI003BA99953
MTRSLPSAPSLFDSRPFGFAQVAVITTPMGRMVHVSGQVAWDTERRIIGRGDVGRQFEKSLENLAIALASAGGSLDDVGALRLYIREEYMGEGRRIAEVLKRTFGEALPCTTWIGVRCLADEAFLIEVEAAPVLLRSAPST